MPDSKSPWYDPDLFAQRLPALKNRMAIIKALHSYFDAQDFMEVETPALQIMPAADKHIHGFETTFFGYDLKPRKTFFLHTSPEFEMKKLLVAGLPKIYQICRVFRNAEVTAQHKPEFTMMEWYRSGASLKDIMNDCVALLRACARATDISDYSYKSRTCDPFKEPLIISVCEAFERFAGIDLESVLCDRDAFAKAAGDIGIRVSDKDAWDDIFFTVMAEKIEPHLGEGTPAILYDYPITLASLSRPKPDDPRFTERFELYVCGVELANAFGELTDAGIQRERFEKEMNEKKDLYGFSYPVDEEFLAALEYGMPESCGIALGVDRLVMLACGAENIDDVLWHNPSHYADL